MQRLLSPSLFLWDFLHFPAPLPPRHYANLLTTKCGINYAANSNLKHIKHISRRLSSNCVSLVSCISYLVVSQAIASVVVDYTIWYICENLDSLLKTESWPKNTLSIRLEFGFFYLSYAGCVWNRKTFNSEEIRLKRGQNKRTLVEENQ